MNSDKIIIQWLVVLKLMFQIYVFMWYSRTLSYLERITLSGLTLMMSKVDLVAISVETLRIDNGCPLDKELT